MKHKRFISAETKDRRIRVSLYVSIVTTLERIVQCALSQHLAHKAGKYDSNNTIERQGHLALPFYF
jgi:hypothetical protein